MPYGMHSLPPYPSPLFPFPHLLAARRSHHLDAP